MNLLKRYSQSVKTKLIINVIFIHAVLMSLIVFDLVHRESHFMQKQLSQKGYDLTSVLASTSSVALLNNDLIALEELIKDLNALKNYDMIFVLDKHAKVKASTHKEYFNKYLDDPVSQSLLKKLLDSDMESFQSSHDSVIDTITRVRVNTITIGYVRTLIDRSALSKELSFITNQGLVYIALAIVLGALFAWLSVRTMTRQLNHVSAIAKKITHKNFNVHFPHSKGDDELATMIRAFEVMTQSIQESLEQLEKNNEIIYNEKELAEVTLSSIGDCVIVTDTTGKVKFINPPAEKIIRYKSSEAVGQKVETLFHIFSEDKNQEMESPLYTSIRENRIVWLSNHTKLINRHGQRFFIEDSSAPIRNKNGGIEGAILVFHDVTEKKRDEKKLQWQASHDTLTSLYNRLSFEMILYNTAKQVYRDRTQHALLFMDLDKFKIINDTVGHLAGDEVLKQVARLLSHTVRDNDYLARFGGDEFGLLLFNTTLEHAKEIAQKIIDTILEYNFRWNEHQFKIGISIGIAVINEHNNNPTAILSSADLACYLAKEKGRNRFYIAKESDLEHLDNEHELNWISRINRALKESTFRLHVQQIKDLYGTKNHYEVLLRMQDDEGNTLYPDTFIPHAENYGLMPNIDRYVIETFFTWFDLHHDSLNKECSFSINLSGQSVSDTELIGDILDLSQRYDIDASRIIFEITETTAIANLQESKDFFHALIERGFSFSLDDFGTGLSSFAYLKTLPIRYLKIDGVFIKNMVEDEIDRGMVESIYKGSLQKTEI